MPEPSDIDSALVSKLGADATLLSHVPNGVYWDEGPPGSTRFVIVSLVSPHEEWKFGGVSHVTATYLVKAVALSTVVNASASAKSAAVRINALLHDGTLTVTGYTLMAMHREPDDDPWIHITEVDEVDPSIRWYHRGGHYRVVMSVG